MVEQVAGLGRVLRTWWDIRGGSLELQEQVCHALHCLPPHSESNARISTSPPQGLQDALGCAGCSRAASPSHHGAAILATHLPADFPGKGLAAWAALPAPLGHQRVQFPQAGVGKVFPGLLSRDDLHVPWGLLADSLSFMLSDSPPSLSFLSLFLFNKSAFVS